MKCSTLVALILVLTFTSAMADRSNDPLLDAKINLAELRCRYGDKHPRIIEAMAQLDAVSQTVPAVAPAAYLLHVQERLNAAQQEDTEVSQRYAEKHPKRLPVAKKLKFLLLELQRIQSPSA